uniref:PREDICTED: similar to transposaselike putative n=1 Tax=Albugo laibachii Nc14 TaxID=890382 RepID=F0WME0_9STRA|nr:PREDICTED: similar to transposaselike putative [Albugo laibachii Nc14]|eukprot:CCA22471.1 PREDICTED: similar to transposaselike putative [Albugo laibachii Nc14]
MNKLVDAKDWESVLYTDEACIQLPVHCANLQVASPIAHVVELDISYYRNLLHEQIEITRELLLLPEKVWFVKDGAPAHRAEETKAVVKELGLDDLGHLPQSPDLNPIEDIWAVMKRELHKNPTSSVEDLKQKLVKIWYSIDKALGRKFTMSIPGRLESVLMQKGGHNKY